jgi:hypothetical protein
VHSHVLAICFRKEKETNKPGLVKEFLKKMKDQAK